VTWLFDLFTSITLLACVVVLVPTVFFGLIAYADFISLGCASSEAHQCGDARGTMTFALSYLMAGPVLWGLMRVLRKVMRKGVPNA